MRAVAAPDPATINCCFNFLPDCADSLGCAGPTQTWLAPDVALTSLKPQKLGLEEQSFLIGLRIKNPNDRMQPIKAMTYALSLEGTEIAAGGGRLDRQIPAFGEQEVEVSVTGSAGTLAADAADAIAAIRACAVPALLAPSPLPVWRRFPTAPQARSI
jgi:hypothetical protein